MVNQLIHFETPIVFIGGSVVNWQFLDAFKNLPIIAVDGGVNSLYEHDLVPQYICGDFDSAQNKELDRWQEKGVHIIHLSDQNYTDLDKALHQFDAPKIYAFGFLDMRLDHTLSALMSLSNHASKDVIFIGEHEEIKVAPSNIDIPLKAGERVSFWSAGETKIHSSSGLKWPLDKLKINAKNMSISNEAMGAVHIVYSGDPLIMITHLESSAPSA